MLAVEPADETYTVLPAPPGPPGPDRTPAIAVGVLGGVVAVGVAACVVVLVRRRRRRLKELRIAAEEEAERNKECMTPRSSARARFGTSPAPAWLRNFNSYGWHVSRVHPPGTDGGDDDAGGATPGVAAHMARMALEHSAASVAAEESPEFSLSVVTPLGGIATAAAAAPDSDASSCARVASVSPAVDKSAEAVASRRARLGKAAAVLVGACGGGGDGGGVAFSIGDGDDGNGGGNDGGDDGEANAASSVADGEAAARAAVAAAVAPQQTAEQAAFEVRRWLSMGQLPMQSLGPTEVRAPARRPSEKMALGDAKAIDAFIKEGAVATASGGVAGGGIVGIGRIVGGGGGADDCGGAGAGGGGAAGATGGADEAEETRAHATIAWLQKLGLSQYAPSFARESMEPTLLASVLREDGKQAAHELLQALGVGFLGHRLRMISALAKVDVVEV